MSQVIVTNDALKAKRDQSKTQEMHIDRESRYARWRMSDVSNGYRFGQLLVLAASPVIALWGLLMVGISWAMGIACALFRAGTTLFR